MPEREGHPGFELAGFERGAEADVDPRGLELPQALLSDLRRGFGRTEEVPGYVDLAVLAAFESRRQAALTRRRSWKFAAIAASVALVVWVGSSNWPTRPAVNVASNPAIGSGNVYGGLAANAKGAAAAEGAGRTLALADSDPTKDAPGSPRVRTGDFFSVPPPAPSGPGGSALAMVDADGNGRVNILDAMRIAKTVQAVQFARELGAKTDAAGGGGAAFDQAKMAFFVSSLDVTWDLTADGVVDQKDADLLAARIVRVGNGGA